MFDRKFVMVVLSLGLLNVLQLWALLNEFYHNAFQQTWLLANFPGVYALLFPSVDLSATWQGVTVAGTIGAIGVGAGIAMVFWRHLPAPGFIWNWIHSRRLETTTGEGVSTVNLAAPRNAGPTGSVLQPVAALGVVPVVSAATGATPKTLTQKIAERMNAPPATSTPQSNGKAPVTGPSDAVKVILRSRNDWTVEPNAE